MKMLLVGDRVRTPGGHEGTVIGIFESSAEVSLDFGGLMHYNIQALKKI